MNKKILLMTVMVFVVAAIISIFFIQRSAVNCGDLKFELIQVGDDYVVISYSSYYPYYPKGETVKTEKIGLGEEKEIIQAPSAGYKIMLRSTQDNSAKLQISIVTGIAIEGYDYSPKVCNVKLVS